MNYFKAKIRTGKGIYIQIQGGIEQQKRTDKQGAVKNLVVESARKKINSQQHHPGGQHLVGNGTLLFGKH